MSKLLGHQVEVDALYIYEEETGFFMLVELEDDYILRYNGPEERKDEFFQKYYDKAYRID